MRHVDAAPRKKPSHKMPDFVREALEENGLMGAYKERPDYQQNDYIGWIIGAKQQETKERRLSQMIEELKLGDRYMNMTHHGKE